MRREGIRPDFELLSKILEPHTRQFQIPLDRLLCEHACLCSMGAQATLAARFNLYPVVALARNAQTPQVRLGTLQVCLHGLLREAQSAGNFPVGVTNAFVRNEYRPL
jgi:hypothetical protein